MKSKSGNRKAESWKNILLRILLFILFFLVLGIINPDTVLSQPVDSLVKEAIGNNPLLKARQYQIEAAGRKAESVNALPPPQVGIEFNEVPFNSANIWNDAVSNSLFVSQMFHLGGKLSAMTEAERMNIPVAQSEYDIAVVDLRSKIKMAYYQLWQIESQMEIQEKNISLLLEMANSADVMYQVNRITQADILTLRSEIASNRTQLVNLRNQKESVIFNLNSLIGRPLDLKDLHTVPEISIDPLPYSDAQLEELLARNNPSIRQMTAMQEMNRAMLEANNREKYPDLMLQGMIMRMPNGMPLTAANPGSMNGSSMGTEYGYSLMASVTLPFAPWSKDRYTRKEEELIARTEGIVYEKQDMQRRMTAGLKAAISRLRTSQEQLKLYSESVIPLYRQAMQSQTAAFQSGKAAINAVIDQNRMLLMQEMNYYMAQADYKMALAEIEMMTGSVLE